MSERPSLSSLANKTASKKAPSSLASLASKAKPVSSLQSLAQRNSSTAQKTSATSSLSHLASRNTSKLGSLASLATKQPMKSPPVKPIATLSPPPPPPPVQTTTKTTTTTTPATPPPTTVSTSPAPEQQQEEVDNPLIAKPSMAAQFLFQPLPTSNPTHLKPTINLKASNIPAFDFNRPSPDDIVLAAQSQRAANKKN
ncbi:hypothetical protein BD770DRAFT_389454 [Pilaira anomala]|nr:hypothetical protein BD770DRAFT_389454 [Pilaira anomala]